MNLSESGKQLIKKYEGCILQAYLCPAKVWTIGYGNTYHPNGTPVKEGDKITKAQALEIAKKKMTDLNAKDDAGAIAIIAGSARSMGITVE